MHKLLHATQLVGRRKHKLMLRDKEICCKAIAESEMEEATHAKGATTASEEPDSGEGANTIAEQNIFKIETTLKELEYSKYDSGKFIEDLIVENAHCNNLCSDIRGIYLRKYYTTTYVDIRKHSFTKYKHKLVPLSAIFIDSILLYKLFPPSAGTGASLHKEVCDASNALVLRTCEELDIKVVKHSVKLTTPVLYGGCETVPTRTSFKQLTEQHRRLYIELLANT